MAGVSPLHSAGLLREFSTTAHGIGFSAEQLGEVEDYPLAAYPKPSPAPCPRLYLFAGIRGDEPAPSANFPLAPQGKNRKN